MTCEVCELLLREALAHLAIVRTPVGSGPIGPEEAATWARLQAVSIIEVAESAARLRSCAVG